MNAIERKAWKEQFDEIMNSLDAVNGDLRALVEAVDVYDTKEREALMFAAGVLQFMSKGVVGDMVELVYGA